MALKIGMVSLGCSKNQIDAERILFKLKKAGYELSDDAGLCDIVIVNTCGFIQSAKEEAIETILEFCTLKKEGRIKAVVITGCLSERYREEVSELISEADAVIGIGCNEDIVEIINKVAEGEKISRFDEKEKLSLTGGRIISTLPFFAYLKVAEGCDNCCSYCAIPSIRGRFRSNPIEEVVKEAEYLVDNGVREINLIAQDTTRYGEDLYGESKLPELLTELCKIENLRWLRVLYCYPERITDKLLDVMAKEEKIVKYLDIPIQHCNDDILKKMNRKGDKKSLTETIARIREKMPDCILRTTLITGFPTETKEQFEELAEFVKEMQFDRLGCFPYSEEEGTKAALMTPQVDEEERQHRADIIMEMQNVISEQKNNKMMGKVVEAVVEGFDRWAECYFGRTKADAPDIDGKIFFSSEEKLAMGQFVKVRIDDTMDYDLIGEVI
ncbi:MAG: 30S ribosomal protein S12 methylthiotransferase RimO [Oscillospiraceae bacterium]|nr:30S ribosomal protein S12 methylthiotransferase RimO [Oscillospiraceae bacterium]